MDFHAFKCMIYVWYQLSAVPWKLQKTPIFWFEYLRVFGHVGAVLPIKTRSFVFPALHVDGSVRHIGDVVSLSGDYLFISSVVEDYCVLLGGSIEHRVLELDSAAFEDDGGSSQKHILSRSAHLDHFGLRYFVHPIVTCCHSNFH